jgi:uncharacterized protein involved in exopolysaccharide biosynthesis
MEESQVVEWPQSTISNTTSRDLAAVFFRRRRLMIITFLAVFLGGVVCALLLPSQYESETKLLVSHQRQDPAISADPKVILSSDSNNRLSSEEDINSEIELITSQDLIKEVVRTCHLDVIVTPLGRIADLFRDTSPEARLARAVDKLSNKLVPAPITGSNLIRVSYRSADPRLSAQVIRTVTDLYLTKHVAVHRPSGAYDFFDKEVERYKRELGDAEKQMILFAEKEDIVSPQLERESAVQKATQMEYELRTTGAATRETENRIASLKRQLAESPERIVTSDRSEPVVLAQLKSTLVSLAMKRTEMLTKFQPTYVPVQQLEKQIALTHQAIADEEASPLRSVTTDRNPLAQVLNEDLAKAQTELADLYAKRKAASKILDIYKQQAQTLLSKGLTQSNILRTAKLAEDNYLLYTNKREEARIAEALDRRRMVKVSVAEAATVPYFPLLPVPLLMLGAFAIACIFSVGSGFAANYLDSSLHTPPQVEAWMQLPLLAAVPEAESKLDAQGIGSKLIAEDEKIAHRSN